MASGLIRVLGIERDELQRVAFLIFQSIFLGIFAGAFDVGAQSLFLKEFSASLIPKAFAVSGAVGIVLTGIYSYFQPRIPFRRFIQINLVLVALLSLALRIGYGISEDRRLIFAMLVLMGPLTILAFLGFWGTVGRMFTLRQGKRLFGLIDTGQILGMILSFYAIPLLITFNFKVANSLYICFVSLFAAIIIQWVINKKFPFEHHNAETGPEPRRNRFFDLFRDRYTLLMVGFVVLSVLSAFFIHYSFLSITQVNYPDPDKLAQFLGVFMGTLMVITLLIKAFVYSKLMKTYGLKVALLISPAILGIFTLIALAIGNFYGYAAGTAGFTLFFLLIVSSKLFAKSLKDAIENPASKVLYQTLDENIRYDVQARIDGTVNELAAFSSGLLMAGLVMMQKITIIHFSFALLLIVILWGWVGVRLYRAYRSSLNQSLAAFKKNLNEIKAEQCDYGDYLSTDRSLQLSVILDLVPGMWNGFLSGNITRLLSHESPGIRTKAAELVTRFHLLEKHDEISKVMDSLDHLRKKEIEPVLRSYLDRCEAAKDEVKSLNLRSNDPEQRIKVLAWLHAHPDELQSIHLLPLLRDNASEVKSAAIRFIGIHGLKELSPAVIDLLDDPVHYPGAYHSLIYMGWQVSDKLESAYYRSGVTMREKQRILRVMVKTGDEGIAPYLINKLDEEDFDLLRMVLTKLRDIKYRPDEIIRNRMVQLLHKLVGLAAWNLSARFSAHSGLPGTGLEEAFDRELNRNYDLIYLLLGILYDPGTINQIRANLESGTSEGIGFAMELLDIFVDENVKPFLFPLLDDANIESKILSLQAEFPVEMVKPVQLLNSVLNRNFNYIKRSTRLLAMQIAGSREDYEPGNELAAHLFNPDEVMHETAAAILQRKSRNMIDLLLPRIPESIRYNIMNHLSGKGKGILMKYKALLESESLHAADHDSVLSLAGAFQTLSSASSEMVWKESPADLIIFTLLPVIFSSNETGSINLDSNSFYRLGRNDGFNLSYLVDKALFLSANALQEMVFEKEEDMLPLLNELSPISTG